MKNSFSILIVVFAVFVFLVSCSEPGSIYGSVSDKATGEWIKDAGVELIPGGRIEFTNSKGYFEFPDISSGNYILSVTKTGYESTESSTITVESGKKSQRNVHLEKKNALRIVDDAKNDISELDFGAKLDDVSRSFILFNDSSDLLDWKITKTAKWIESVSEESGELKADEKRGIIVVIDRSLLREGENLSQLHITSSNGNKQLAVKATDSDACKNNPCGEHGICKATGVKTYKCLCDEGYFSNDIKCVDPCADEPCIGLEHSTGKCVAKDAFSYSCECNDTFSWNGNKCLNPCDPNPCEGLEHSTGICSKEDAFTQYSCGCEDNYEWENSSCVGAKRTYNCNGLPEHAVWNSASSYTQTWNGTSWFPPDSSAAYSEAESTTECRFKCNTNYYWNTSALTCDAAKQTVNCTAKPANTVWNTVSTVTQTWNGNAWTPSNTSSYNTTASSSECRYKCDNTHYWYNSECISPCDYTPCNEVANSTKVCTATSWHDYFCGCNSWYTWNGIQCVKKAFGNICTGQTQCYNASTTMTCPISSDDFFGQDSQYAELGYCIPQNFTIDSTVDSEKTVIDNNTGLEWQQTLSGSTYTRGAAKTYCDDLNYGGHDDWRLPTPKELASIINLDKSSPAIDSVYFPNTPTGKFVNTASSSTQTGAIICGGCVGSTCKKCPVSSSTLGFTQFDTGINSSVTCGYVNPPKQVACPTDFYVRCVRGNTLEHDAFVSSTINSNVVVTDSTTGLMWQKTCASKTWQAALKYCEDLTYAGYSDWRLPNKNELASLINIGTTSTTSDFPGMSLTIYFWSSSTSSSNPNQAWRVKGSAFNFTETADKTTSANVRCVRTVN